MNPDLKCADVVELLPDYLADAVEPQVADEMAAHFETCPACAMQLATERRLDQLVFRAVNEATPAAGALQTRIVAHVNEHAAPVHRWWRYALVAAAVASFALGLAIWSGYGEYSAHLLCADAADDHYTEIVRNDPRKWRTSQTEIAALSQKELGGVELPQTIEGQNLTLVRARVCRLRGDRFMHLVYSQLGGRDVSVFLGLNHGNALERRASASSIHAEQDEKQDIATFHTGNLVVVVASDAASSMSTQVASQLAHTF